MWGFVASFVIAFAQGPAPAPPITVRWEGPPECQARDRVEAALADRLGRPLGDPQNQPMAIGVAARVEDERWVASLTFTSHGTSVKRTLDAGTCGALADAVALVASIAIAEREADPPPEPLPPEPDPGPDPVRPSPPPAPLPAETPRPRPWGGLAVQGRLSAGALPGLGTGLGLVATVGRRRIHGEAFGAYRFPTTVRRPGEASQGGTLELARGGLAGCYDLGPDPERLWFPACAVAEGGAIFSRGVGLPRSQRDTSLWFAAGARLGVGIDVFRGLSLEASGAIVAPFSRPEFVVEGDEQPLATVGPVEIQLGLSLGYRFR